MPRFRTRWASLPGCRPSCSLPTPRSALFGLWVSGDVSVGVCAFFSFCLFFLFFFSFFFFFYFFFFFFFLVFFFFLFFFLLFLDIHFPLLSIFFFDAFPLANELVSPGHVPA